MSAGRCRVVHAILLGATLVAPVRAEVWYSPNVASVDMLDLFTLPEQWDVARSKVDVFKFDSGHVGSDGWSCDVNPNEVCGENYLQHFVEVQAFSKLGQWDIDLAIESFFAGPVMAVDPIVCTTDQRVLSLTLNGSINVIQNVQANGGVVKCLAMDEPLRQWLPEYYYTYSGQTDPRPCLADSIGIIADHMAAYFIQMEEWFPSIPIGQIDLYPEVGVDQFKEWILALEARGTSLPFLHLDVNVPRLDQYNAWGLNIDMASDFAELNSFCELHSIQFGIIYTDTQWNSQLWEEDEYDDRVYYESTLDWIATVEATGVELDHEVFQSWVMPYYTTGPGPKEIPINLPESNAAIFSHTRLINEALGTVVAVGTGPWRSGSRLHQNQPNPFQPRTVIRYDVHTPSRVTLKVYDARGREVRVLVEGDRAAGEHFTQMDAGDLPAGVYFYRLKVGASPPETRRMVIWR